MKSNSIPGIPKRPSLMASRAIGSKKKKKKASLGKASRQSLMSASY